MDEENATPPAPPVTLKAPAGVVRCSTGYGSYEVDRNGQVTVDAGHVGDLLNAGFTLADPVGAPAPPANLKRMAPELAEVAAPPAADEQP